MNVVNDAIFNVNGKDYIITSVWRGEYGITTIEFRALDATNIYELTIKEFLSKTGDQFESADTTWKKKFYSTRYKENNQHPLLTNRNQFQTNRECTTSPSNQFR